MVVDNSSLDDISFNYIKEIVTIISGIIPGPTTKITLYADDTTNVILGSLTTDGSIIINYAAKRGALYQQGEITLLNKVSSTDVLHEWDGDDIGLTVTSDILGDNLRVNMVVDNSSLDDISFNYIKEIVTI
jgi:hypothetical protein